MKRPKLVFEAGFGGKHSVDVVITWYKADLQGLKPSPGADLESFGEILDARGESRQIPAIGNVTHK